MWSLFLALTWSAVAASSLFLKATPESILQEITPESQQPISDGLDVDQYLRTYGYMNDVNERSQDEAQRRTDALKLFQRFAGLQVTGEADEYTRQQMLRPRCGMKDIETDRPSNTRWNVTEITYRFRSYGKDLSKRITWSAFVDALSQWSVPSKLKFKKTENSKSIMEIRFVTGKHPPCTLAMDGPGGSIAHTFFPSGNQLGGDMHFDDAETFKYKEGSGLELVSVVLHESGHALGLGTQLDLRQYYGALVQWTNNSWTN